MPPRAHFTFRGGSRASVVGVRSVDLNKLVRAQRSIVALKSYAVRGVNAKRKQSATKSTPAGHVSYGAVAFHGGAGELKLEPCVQCGIVRRNDDVFDARDVVASAHVRAHASRNHCGFVCTGESHGKTACVCFVVAAVNRWIKGKSQPTKPCPLFVVVERVPDCFYRQIRSCQQRRFSCLSGRHCPALVLISAKQSSDFHLNAFETSRNSEMKFSFLAQKDCHKCSLNWLRSLLASKSDFASTMILSRNFVVTGDSSRVRFQHLTKDDIDFIMVAFR